VKGSLKYSNEQVI